MLLGWLTRIKNLFFVIHESKLKSVKDSNSGQFSGYISPQNIFTHFICSVLMSKKFVCHVLKNPKSNRAKLLYDGVREGNFRYLPSTFSGNRNGRFNKSFKSRTKV